MVTVCRVATATCARVQYFRISNSREIGMLVITLECEFIPEERPRGVQQQTHAIDHTETDDGGSPAHQSNQSAYRDHSKHVNHGAN